MIIVIEYPEAGYKARYTIDGSRIYVTILRVDQNNGTKIVDDPELARNSSDRYLFSTFERRMRKLRKWVDRKVINLKAKDRADQTRYFQAMKILTENGGNSKIS